MCKIFADSNRLLLDEKLNAGCMPGRDPQGSWANHDDRWGWGLSVGPCAASEDGIPQILFSKKKGLEFGVALRYLTNISFLFNIMLRLEIVLYASMQSQAFSICFSFTLYALKEN